LSFKATFSSTIDPSGWSSSKLMVVHGNGGILMVRTQLSFILGFCLSILVKKISYQERKLFGLD
jgi:hypothetical protein